MVANPLERPKSSSSWRSRAAWTAGEGGRQKMEGYVAALSIRAQPLRLSACLVWEPALESSIPTSTHSRHVVWGHRNRWDPSWVMGQEGPILQKMICRAKKGERRRWDQCDVMVPRREWHRRNRVSCIRKIIIIYAVGLVGIGL